MVWGRMLMLSIPFAIAAVAGARDDKKKATAAPPSPPPDGTPPPGPGPVPTQPAAAMPPGSWLAGFGEQWSLEREAYVLEGIKQVLYDPPEFRLITSIGEPGSPLEGYLLSVPVMADDLKFEGVRVIGDYQTAQLGADAMGLQIITPWIAGLVYEQSDAKLTPTAPQPASATKTQMLKVSRGVDKKLAALGQLAGVPLVGNPDKDWVLTIKFSEPGVHPKTGQPHATAAANHGLYTSPWQPIQNVGVAHNLFHTDGTQGLRYMGKESTLRAPDGSETFVPTAGILMNTDLAPLLTGRKGRIKGKQVGEGVLPYWRHPAIPENGVLA